MIKKLLKMGFFACIVSFFLIACTADEPGVEVDARDKLVFQTGNELKLWNCESHDPIFGEGTAKQTYQSVIKKDNTIENRIIITNFHGLGNAANSGTQYEAYATLNNLTITLPKQEIDGFNFEGTGSVSADYTDIEWNYTIEEVGAGEGPKNAEVFYTIRQVSKNAKY